jgi:hypothetical protein
VCKNLNATMKKHPTMVWESQTDGYLLWHNGTARIRRHHGGEFAQIHLHQTDVDS